jgi:hypothetical protein
VGARAVEPTLQDLQEKIAELEARLVILEGLSGMDRPKSQQFDEIEKLEKRYGR